VVLKSSSVAKFLIMACTCSTKPEARHSEGIFIWLYWMEVILTSSVLKDNAVQLDSISHRFYFVIERACSGLSPMSESILYSDVDVPGWSWIHLAWACSALLRSTKIHRSLDFGKFSPKFNMYIR
jgi:hypothetical protein